MNFKYKKKNFPRKKLKQFLMGLLRPNFVIYRDFKIIKQVDKTNRKSK